MKVEAPLKIFTDGGCSGNPGPGGWAYIIVREISQGPTIVAEQYGAERASTNNRMELTAVIEALRKLKTMKSDFESAGSATVITDSQYVQKGITEWIFNWKRNAWRTSDKKPVKNQDLWMELDSLAGELSPGWEWVRGHAGNEFNERCDRMTQEAIALVASC